MIEGLVAVLILIGSAFALIGSIGLARLPDFYMRLHGPTKATTLGVGAVVIASVVYFNVAQPGLEEARWTLSEILITVFLFITAPVSAHLLAKAALHVAVRSRAEPPPEAERPGREDPIVGEKP